MRTKHLSVFLTIALFSTMACSDDDTNVNTAPTVNNPISALNFARGFMSSSVDLSTVFADAENDDLTLSGASSNTEVVSIAIDGNTLTISEGTISGSATITITADDGQGNITSTDFLVTVAVEESVSTENIFAMPIRKVVPGVSIDDFKAARDAYVAVLEQQPGTIADREMQPFGDFVTFNFFTPDLDSIFIGFTAFQNLTVFQDIGAATGSTQEAIDFFGADGSGGVVFNFLDFLLLQPLNNSESVDLSTIAVQGSGQVWEVAVRDLSQYEGFDQADYETRRDAYLAVLAAQTPTWVQEIQWVDITNPNKVVGMTIYADQQTYLALQQNQAFIDAYTETGFLQAYPINVYGGIHNVLK